MTQLDILAKNVTGHGTTSFNVVGVGGVTAEEAKFEELYKDEVNFLANQEGVYRENFPTLGGNQGFNRDKGYRDHDREWRDQNYIWKERYGVTMSIRRLNIFSVTRLKICSHVFSTRLKGPIKF